VERTTTSSPSRSSTVDRIRWMRRRRERGERAPGLTDPLPGRSKWRALLPGRLIRWLLLLGLIVCGSGWAIHLRNPTLDRNPGRVLADFELTDASTGRVHRLSQYRGRVVVVVFTGTSCPVGDLYVPRLAALATAYKPRKVDFLAINSNASETIDEVAAHARESGANYPVLKDPENRVADRMLVERTCEALVIDGHGRLLYRGAIDNQYGLSARRDTPEKNYLVDAIEAVLAGRAVAPETTQVVGCPIERTVPSKVTRRLAAAGASRTPPSRPDEKTTASSDPPHGVDRVTYSSDVAPILNARCVPCHRPGQVAPFPLLTYDQALRWATSIAEVVTEGRMPPWHADPRYGHFANDRSLTARERSLLIDWVERGAPAGDRSFRPKPIEHAQGWSIGTPDAVFEMPLPEPIPAEGTVPIKRYRVAVGHAEDLWVQAAEARPGDRAVVHHICVFIDDHVKRSDGKPRLKNLLVSYTPGDMPSVYPAGVAKKISKGSELLFEVHYTPIGKARFDRSSVGLILAKEPPRYLAITRGLPQYQLKIPPGASDHVVQTNWLIRSDIHLLGMTPHMHLRGKSFEYRAQYPDGRAEILLSVPNYDFNWQSVYRLAEPKPLPNGTRILCEAHFDNSSANLANPDPKATVVWGEQTEDEMMIGFVDYFEDAAIAK
jgi:peroxiredoxin